MWAGDCHVGAIGKMNGCITTAFLPPFPRNSGAGDTAMFFRLLNQLAKNFKAEITKHKRAETRAVTFLVNETSNDC